MAQFPNTIGFYVDPKNSDFDIYAIYVYLKDP